MNKQSQQNGINRDSNSSEGRSTTPICDQPPQRLSPESGQFHLSQEEGTMATKETDKSTKSSITHGGILRGKTSDVKRSDNRDCFPPPPPLNRTRLSQVGAVAVPGINGGQNTRQSRNVTVSTSSDAPVIPSAFLVDGDNRDESAFATVSMSPPVLVKAERDERKPWYLSFHDVRTRLIFLGIVVLVVSVIGLSVGIWLLARRIPSSIQPVRSDSEDSLSDDSRLLLYEEELNPFQRNFSTYLR